jgi:para-nitrobenzyl esterase
MVAALTWVRGYIASFGGDPEQVTVAGQSAGAHAIMALLAMPDTRDLFQRAILQSAPAGVAPLSNAAARERGERFAALLGAEWAGIHDDAERVRTAPIDRLLQATGLLARESVRFGEISPPFLPVLDHLADPERFVPAAAAGAAGKDVIIGTTRDEAHAFFAGPQGSELDLTALGAFLTAQTGRADALAAYQQRRPGARPGDLLADLVTDRIFLDPSLQFADAAVRAGANVWMYRFDWAPPKSSLGACHGIELPFVFGTLDAWREAPMLRGGDPRTMTDLSRTVGESWGAFVRQGNPAVAELAWPGYQPDRRQTMVFGEIVSAVGDPFAMGWPPGRAA